MRILLVAGMLFPLSAAATQQAAAEEGVEYVRVCDAFGTGFFYIPGTETCLRIGGRVTTSFIQRGSTLGGGTVVRNAPPPGGDKSFSHGFANFATRFGGGIDVEYGLGASDYFSGWNTGIFGGFEYAGSRETSTGNQTYGQDGVMGLGFTYIQPVAPGNTGVIAAAPGFGMMGNGQFENSWYRALGGFEYTGPIGDDDSNGQSHPDGYLTKSIGLQFEHYSDRASGNTELTFNGVLFNNHFQNYTYISQDTFYGIYLALEYYKFITEKFAFYFGGNVVPGLRCGNAQFDMTTGIGVGTTVMESYTRDRCGVVVGGGFHAGVDFKATDGLSLGFEAKGDILPGVGSFRMPTNPNEQANAGFYDANLWRLGVNFTISAEF